MVEGLGLQIAADAVEVPLVEVPLRIIPGTALLQITCFYRHGAAH